MLYKFCGEIKNTGSSTCYCNSGIQNEFRISQRFNKPFLELKLLPLTLPAFLFLLLFAGMEDYSSGIFNVNKLILDTQLPYYIIGVFFTFIICLFGTLMIVYIKSISHTGFKEGLLKRVGLFSLIQRMYHHTKKLLSPLFTFNANHHLDRKIILLVSINALITMFIGLAWADNEPTSGSILVLAYNIFIFYILSRQLEKLKKLYVFSKQLSQGDFHAQLEENIGVLQPIANHLNVINESLKIAVEQEVRSQNMKAALISNVSHDLKTPLTSIITYVDFLKEKDLPSDKQAEYIDILDRKSKRLKILIEDLFEASKAASGNIELHSENVDLVALLKQTLGELEEKISISNLQLRPTFPGAKIICYLDRRRTYRIFENLMSNILKYAQPNSRVYIDITTTEDLATVTFKNISAYEMNFDAPKSQNDSAAVIPLDILNAQALDFLLQKISQNFRTEHLPSMSMVIFLKLFSPSRLHLSNSKMSWKYKRECPS